MSITFTNNFHNTQTTVRGAVGDRVSRRTERRVWKALCGFPDCTCGGAGGIRGGDLLLTHHIYWPKVNDGKPYKIEAR